LAPPAANCIRSTRLKGGLARNPFLSEHGGQKPANNKPKHPMRRRKEAFSNSKVTDHRINEKTQREFWPPPCGLFSLSSALVEWPPWH
jgi:hypothetical protein